MMIEVAYLLLAIFLLTVNGAKIPSTGVPSFVRSAVESIPQIDEGTLAKYSLKPTFGEVFLPLRSAVESAPSVGLAEYNVGKTFVRSSVEYNPQDDYEPIAEESHPHAVYLEASLPEESHPEGVYVENPNYGNEYAAYILPTGYDQYPAPYRSDSPYQSLVGYSPNADGGNIEPDNFGVRDLYKKKKDFTEKPKVLCYVTNWSFYRTNDGKFAPENLDTSLCTALIYSFASLDPKTLMIKEFDPWVDLENDLYKRYTALDIPVLIAMGGWTDSTADKYSSLVSSQSARQTFASNLVSFINQYGFNGFHFDWNYPKCWQSDCKKGPASDKPNLTKLIQEIRTQFDRINPDLQLGVAISGYKEVITEGYDLRALSEYADYLTVMSYDYHGAWEHQTGHVSPLYGRPGDKYPQYNTDYTIQLLLKSGAAKEKLIMGVPFYGQTYTLKETYYNVVGEGVPSVGPGEPGEYTKQPGMMAYYEICQRVRKNKWQVGRDSSRKSGPHAMLRNQWVGYEDPASVEAKARYALNSGLGGIAAWTVDLDDFLNRCCSESFPLLKAINRALGLLSTPPPSGSNCQRPPQPVTPVAPVMTTVADGNLPGGIHEHTTWPSWKPKPSSTKKPETTTWPAWSSSKRTTVATVTTSTTKTSTTTRRPTTTRKPTTTKEPTTSTAWWQSTSTEASTWWPKPPSTTTTTTTTAATAPSTTRGTRRPTTTSWTSTTTRKPVQETTIIPSPAVVMPISSPDGEKCEDGQYKPHPTKCSNYYQCVYNIMTLQSCPGGLEWHTEGHRCDWPQNVNCKVSQKEEVTSSKPAPTKPTSTKPPNIWWTSTTTRKTTPKTTSRRTTRRSTTVRPVAILSSTSSRPSDGLCENGIYYPHDDCDAFYICINGKLTPMHCGPGLQWNTKEKSCDWEDNVRCISKSTYLRLVNFRANADDPCEGSQFIPYPGDCQQFLICVHNRLEVSQCAPGLHWNNDLKICDWPKRSGCQDGQDGQDGEYPGVDQEQNVIDTKPIYAPPSTTTTSTTPRPTYPTNRPNLQPLSGYYKVVCYFTNWAWYRRGIAKYTPDDIDTNLCTHIVYGFAVLDYSELTIRTHDSWADIDNKFYQRVAELKNKGVKVTLALGGWNDSQGDKYSRLVRSHTARAKFVRQSIEFIEKYGFEGLDLDWEYPVCWQTECNKGFPDEKEGFTALVRDLSKAFKPRGLLLSSAVSPSKKIIDAGYDVPELSKYFDWIAVMTYDFHGQWDKKTGHVAPLYYHPEDDIDYFNANYSLNYWMEKGAPSRKLVMGMPLYGQSFTLSDTRNTGLNAHAPGPGQAGEFTRAAGFLAYYEICDRIKTRDWQVVKDEYGRIGPYAYKGNQWVSFDDKETLRRKSQLVRSLNLGGGMVWALDLDDFRNRCGEGVHPLLTSIRNVLKDPPKDYEHPPEPPQYPENPDVVEGISTADNEAEIIEASEGTGTAVENEVVEQQPEIDPNLEVEEVQEAGPGPEETEMEVQEPSGGTSIIDDFKVVCYFTNWAWYRQSGGKYLPEDIAPDLCTHIVYGFAVLNRDSLTIKSHDPWADVDNKFYERVVALKSKGKKVTVAIGGWNDSAGDKYSRLVRDPGARAKFVTNVIEFIEKWGFDGLDLDWEYPVCWQVDCKKGYADEKEGFADLVRELSEQFKPRGLLLSSAVSPNKKVIDAGYDVPTLSQYFDWIAVMTYDYHGQWDKKTGHVAPMYTFPGDNPTFNANFSINYWLEQGADRKKIIMGMPMYGQSFSLADNKRHNLNAPTYGGGEAGDATRARGFLSYYEICRNIRERGWTVVRDRLGRMGPYAYHGDQWVSFDDASMIRHKSEYVKAMELGGAMIWALDLDDFRNVCDCETYPLLKTINRVLRDYPGPGPKCKLEDKAEIAPEIPDLPEMSTQSTPVTWWPTQSSTQWWSASSTTPRTTPRTTPKSTSRATARPTYPQRTTDKPTKAPVDHDLSCKGRTFVAHDEDCNKYYLCQFGMLMEQRCPPGLYWNRDHCDWPHNADCQIESLPQPPSTTRRPTTPKPQRPSTVKPSKKPVTSPPKRPDDHQKPIYPKPPIHNDGKYKVVCYFTNWAWYRPGEGKYTPNDIDENLCTHIVYGFAVLNRDSLTIKTHDSWADIDNRFYERVAEYRNKGIRVTLAIGGWNDSLGDKYSRLVRDPQARARFVKHVVEFLEKYGFEGLDLDWEYPVCWQVDCDKGFPDEKQGFSNLVRELSEEFKPRGLLLSAAVSPSKKVIDAGYDVPTLAKYFDWIAVMTYDFHGHWDKQTGHVAPLYYVPGDTYEYFNGNFSINYWIEKGAPPSKLIMGMPLYGQTFALDDSTKRGLNSKAQGPGQAGKYTRAAGFLAYYEICEKVNNGGWTVVRDKEGRIGPYAYKDRQWVSYDDVEEIRRKSRFVKSMGLGGGMVWALDLDDFRGRCGCGKHPLLRTMNQELRGIQGQRASDCT